MMPALLSKHIAGHIIVQVSLGIRLQGNIGIPVRRTSDEIFLPYFHGKFSLDL
ncbi:hypothetical protein ACRQ5D_22865 [Mucilaginibacter sp. P25]|uniref:hypothetical protein n=1 Tax=Mucilaginibacter TaxID=423349 RepID=UPI0015A1C13D|nr:hypothetical protein [Mucilaginibacter gossypii]